MNSENLKAHTRLTEEAITDVAGGQDDPSTDGMRSAPCPKCNTMNDPYDTEAQGYCVVNRYKCSNCGWEYSITSGA